MKIFGNRKRRPVAAERQSPAPRTARRRREAPEVQSRLAPRTRAALLLMAAVILFAASTAVCLYLINRSAQPLELNVQTKAAPLKYVVDADPPPQVDAPVALEAPAGVNNSRLLNILLLAVDPANDSTDTLVLMNVNLNNAEVGMLSIPRDTFVSGNYEMPKIDRVYAETGTRGVQALQEQIHAMFGFRADYYFTIDRQALETVFAATGPISFEIPAEPDYSGLSAGTRELTAADALQLLCFDADYTEVSTEPARVQRSLLQTILDRLLDDQENVQENAKALAAAADTDLTAENLMYFGYLLKDTNFSASFSRALPGTEVKVGGYAFYQVDADEALELINANLNPLPEPLTLFDLNFRQKTGSSTEGEFSDFGFTSKTESTGEDETTSEETAQPPSDEPDTQSPDAPTTEP